MKKVIACALAITLLVGSVMSGFALQGIAQQNEGEGLAVFQFSGINRYDTARQVAMNKYPEGANTVLIVRGDDVEGMHQISDALSASALAGVLQAPILPVNQKRDGLPGEILDGIEALGASKAIIVGGPAAVNEKLEEQLKDVLGSQHVRRIEHETIKNRYGTALAVAQEVVNEKGMKTLLLTRGADEHLVDSLAIGPVAYREGYPILFVDADRIPEGTKAFIEEYVIEDLIFIGGTGIIDEEVVEQGKTLVSGSVRRVAGIRGESGDDRFGTALEIAREFFMESKEVSLVNGYRFVDAVAASIFGIPILYVEKDFLVPQNGMRTYTVEDYLSNKRAVRVIGGKATLSDAIEETLAQIIIEEEEVEEEPVLPDPEPRDFAGGNGSLNNPYQVQTAEHLNNVRNYLGSEHSEVHFVQTADIDLGVSPWNEGEGWEPIGDNQNQFRGVYNGDGHSIDNLKINRPEDNYIGLFGYIEEAEIQSIRIIASDISGREYVGSLVGYNSGTINKADTSGAVEGFHYQVGGLAGYNSGIIENSFASVMVTGGNNQVGGLVGQNAKTIINSYAIGDVISSADYVGGLAGSNSSNGNIENSFATGAVEGKTFVGGLVGSSNSSTIKNTYAMGTVAGSGDHIGGLVGHSSSGSIEKSYAAGMVSGSGNVGGIVGNNGSFNDILNCYWDKDTTAQSEGVGFTNMNPGTNDSTDNGKSSLEMTDESTFGSWDFAEPGIWKIIEGQSYPYFQWQSDENIPYPPAPFAEGSGTVSDPYKVATAQELDAVRYYRDKHFFQTEDIDLTDMVWEPIGGFSTGSQFTGSYDGNNKTINHLTIVPDASDQYVGLFGVIGYDLEAEIYAKLSNINLENIIIRGTELHSVGALVGRANNNTTIENCSAFGEITALDQRGYAIGGLVGVNNATLSNSEANVTIYVSPTGTGSKAGGLAGHNGGHIDNSFATGDVTGSKYVGGLLGWNSSSPLTNSYSTGNITGNESVGGLIGLAWGVTEKSFSSGHVNGNSDVGGLIGSLAGYARNVYASGSVTGDNTVGGLVGFYSGGGSPAEITNAYAYGQVSGSSNTSGLVGKIWESSPSAPITSSYWDTETTGRSNSVGGTGYVTSAMIKESNSVPIYVDWDFTNIWTMKEGLSYPYFKWQNDNHVPYPPREFAGGEGTEEDPWRISTPQHMDNIRNYLGTENSDKHFRLMNNINLAEYLGEGGPGYNDGAGWLPIGQETEIKGYEYFAGVFDGNDMTISNLYIDRPEMTYVALFRGVGYTTGQGKITSLNMEGAVITGKSYVGVLAGRNVGTIEEITIDGTVEGYGDVGVILGLNVTGSIKNSIARGSVTTNNSSGPYVGGIVGRSIAGNMEYCVNESTVVGAGTHTGGLAGWSSTSITHSSNTGIVTGNLAYTGGVVGYNKGGHIRYSYNSGAVTGTGDSTGGLVGISEWYIEYSYNTGRVTSEGVNTGGLVGYNKSKILDSYNWGEVQGTAYTGGLVGRNEGMNSGSYADVSRTYSIGAVSGGDHTGGLIGAAVSNSSVGISFWNTETSNQTTSAGGEAKTTVEMKQQSTYPTTGVPKWNFDTVWDIYEGDSYPLLRWSLIDV